jgi:hypothetical protein
MLLISLFFCMYTVKCLEFRILILEKIIYFGKICLLVCLEG